MSEDLLFPSESITQDSPRLAWVKKHEVRTWFTKSFTEEGTPWCAWFPDNESEPGGIPDDPEACGYGMTEEEAMRDLAVRYKVPLWNEE